MRPGAPLTPWARGPLAQNAALSELFAANVPVCAPGLAVERGLPFCGSTDMGDVSYLLPVIQPTVSGFSGAAHSRDFAVADEALAYLAPAKLMAATVIDLLAGGAAKGRSVLAGRIFRAVAGHSGAARRGLTAAQHKRQKNHPTGGRCMTAVFLLCTIILFVLQTLSMKLQHAEHLPQKLLVNCAFSLLAAAAMGAGRLAVPDMFTVSPATLRHGLAFGVLFALTILFYNLAIASGPLSYTTFYFSASMLVPAFAGVLLFGEALTFTLAAAVALFLAAFWCLNVAPGGAQKPEPRWLTLCALTFLCNGLCAVVQKSQQNATGGAEAAGLMLVGFCTAAACYALAYLALRGRLPAGAADGAALLRQNALAAVLLAGGSVGGNLLLTWLAGRVDASYLFPLVQGSIIVGVTLCSVLLFREKLSARGRLGILLGVAAIAVINL